MPAPGLLLLVDLDGVLYRGLEPVPGIAAVLAARAARGDDVVYVTNNSMWYRADYVERIAQMGAPVSADQMTISTPAGGSRIVLLTPTTTVTQVTAATKATSDITSGETVTVVGTTNPDGSVTASRIVIGDVSLFGRGGNGAPANASPSPSGAP